MNMTDIQFVSDTEGNEVAVIIPIAIWREIAAERETAYLLKSETMKQRLIEALNRQDGMDIEDVCEKLGI